MISKFYQTIWKTVLLARTVADSLDHGLNTLFISDTTPHIRNFLISGWSKRRGSMWQRMPLQTRRLTGRPATWEPWELWPREVHPSGGEHQVREVELALFTQYPETNLGKMFLCVEPAQVNERGDRSYQRPCRVSWGGVRECLRVLQKS